MPYFKRADCTSHMLRFFWTPSTSFLKIGIKDLTPVLLDDTDLYCRNSDVVNSVAFIIIFWLCFCYFLMHSVLQEIVFIEHVVLDCLRSCHDIKL